MTALWPCSPRVRGKTIKGLGNVAGLKRTSHGVKPGPRNHGENGHPALPRVRSKDSAEIGVDRQLAGGERDGAASGGAEEGRRIEGYRAAGVEVGLVDAEADVAAAAGGSRRTLAGVTQLVDKVAIG